MQLEEGNGRFKDFLHGHDRNRIQYRAKGLQRIGSDLIGDEVMEARRVRAAKGASR